jgi:hypothetical protein
MRDTNIKPSSEPNPPSDSWPDAFAAEVAERKKKRFLRLVEARAHYLDVKHEETLAAEIVKAAKTVVALNLPSNLDWAAVLFVDRFYGLGPQRDYMPPQWVNSRTLLPESERGSLACSGLQNLDDLEEGDCVVLTRDIPSHHLMAGRAGVIRELPSDQRLDGGFSIEFGEPEDCVTVEARVRRAWLRPPWPGDHLENYHLK